MTFSWIDVGIALFVAFGAFRGLRRGLVREGMAFAGLAAGIVLGARWSGQVAAFLRPLIGEGPIVDALAYVLVVLAVLAAATVVTVILRRLMGLVLLGSLDRLGGLLFGAAQGALLAAVALVLLVRYPILGSDGAVRGSEIAVILLQGVTATLAQLPPELSPVVAFFRLPNVP